MKKRQLKRALRQADLELSGLMRARDVALDDLHQATVAREKDIELIEAVRLRDARQQMDKFNITVVLRRAEVVALQLDADKHMDDEGLAEVRLLIAVSQVAADLGIDLAVPGHAGRPPHTYGKEE